MRFWILAIAAAQEEISTIAGHLLSLMLLPMPFVIQTLLY